MQINGFIQNWLALAELDPSNPWQRYLITVVPYFVIADVGLANWVPTGSNKHKGIQK